MNENPPLLGKRMVVTRARAQASSLVIALRELGAVVIELPTIETVSLDSYSVLDEALKNLLRYQWLIATSANTVRILLDRSTLLGMDRSAFTSLRKVAIGSATAKAMRDAGIGVDLVPEQYVAEALVKRLGEDVRGSRVLLARAALARDVIPDELSRCGAIVDVADAYRTVIPEGAVEQLRQAFSDASQFPDAVTFTSSSTVKHFFALWSEAGFAGIPKRVAAMSIGPVTSQTLREFHWEPAVEAQPHDVEGLVDAAIRHYVSPPSGLLQAPIPLESGGS